MSFNAVVASLVGLAVAGCFPGSASDTKEAPKQTAAPAKGRETEAAAPAEWPAETNRAAAARHVVGCESQLPPAHQSHFAKLAWARDGTTALLDNGTIVTRAGKLAGRASVSADHLAFQVQWEPQRARAAGG